MMQKKLKQYIASLILFLGLGMSLQLKAAGADDFVITLKASFTSYNFNVNGFNSGSFQEVGAGGALIGTPTSFATPSTTITVSGLTVGSTYQFRFVPNTSTTQEFSHGYSDALKDINQWGTAKFKSINLTACTGLTTLSATDKPIFAPGASMDSMFWGCSNLNTYVGNWDTTNVTSMGWVFRECTKFNNGEAPGLSSAPLNWDTSNVTLMRDMFADAKAFNQDIGNWDVSHVSDMTVMFAGANRFNQDLSAWQIPLVGSLGNAFNNTNMSFANIDAMLISWAGQTVQSGVLFGADGRTYCTALPAINTLRANGWTISTTSGGLSQECGDSFIITMLPTSSSYTLQNMEGFSTGKWVGHGYFNMVQQGDFTPNLAGGSHTITGLTPGYRYEIRLRPDPTVLQGFQTDHTSELTDINQWGTANWKNLQNAFEDEDGLTTLSATDKPIFAPSADLSSMFYNCNNFNSYIGDWNTTNVIDMSNMFSETTNFNQNIGNWNTGQVTSMDNMFRMAYLFNNGEAPGLSNNPLNWDTSNVTNMQAMFLDAHSFNQPIGTWNTANVTNMSLMFRDATLFNQDISAQPGGIWDTSAVIDMSQMFFGVNSGPTNFNNGEAPGLSNKPLNWNTANVNNMEYMFSIAPAFNQPIGTWDTGKVVFMNDMFNQATAFNQPIGTWDTSKVTNMSNMFSQATAFNQPIGTWDTGKVLFMNDMFNQATAFNQPIGTWDTSTVDNMSNMFRQATAFDQDLSNWQVSSVKTSFFGNMYNIFDNTAMSLCNMDKTLIGWAGQAVHNGISFSAAGREYCRAASAINTLSTTYGWSIDTTSPGALALSATCSGSLPTCTIAELGTIQINGSKLQGCTGTGWIDMADVTAIGPAATTESKIYYDATAHKLLVQEGSNIYQARAPITSCGFTTLSSLAGAAPVEGTLTFDSVTKEFYYHDGTQWVLIQQSY